MSAHLAPVFWFMLTEVATERRRVSCSPTSFSYPPASFSGAMVGVGVGVGVVVNSRRSGSRNQEMAKRGDKQKGARTYPAHAGAAIA